MCGRSRRTAPPRAVPRLLSANAPRPPAFGAQFPAGMMREVLAFVTQLLAQITQPLLPHQGVYRPVGRLVEIARARLPRPRQPDEEEAAAAFAAALAARLSADPMLADFFVGSAATAARPGVPARPADREALALLELLATLVTCERDPTRRVACKALALVLSLPSPVVARAVAAPSSTVCAVLVRPFPAALGNPLLFLYHSSSFRRVTYGSSTRSCQTILKTWKPEPLSPISCSAWDFFFFLGFRR
jgi:hypothetical protein